MTFDQWLNWACKHRGIHTDDRMRKHLFPNLWLNNGVCLSVQASEYHLCIPEETLNDGSKYEAVEVYSGKHISGLTGALGNDTYPRVYKFEMEHICEVNGGINVEKSINYYTKNKEENN